MKELQQYTYTIPANGSVQIPAANDNFIIQASTGPLAVRGNTFGRMRGLVAGQGFKQVPFERLELFDESGAPNTVTLLMSPAEFVNQTFSGSVVIVGAQALDAATINALIRPEQKTGSAVTSAALVAATAQQLIAPGVNVNGIVLLSAGFQAVNAGVSMYVNIVAKASAPASLVDGDVIVNGQTQNFTGGTACNGNLSITQYLDPGLGLYIIGTGAAPSCYSHARWKAL